jgi:hypothetical protein
MGLAMGTLFLGTRHIPTSIKNGRWALGATTASLRADTLAHPTRPSPCVVPYWLHALHALSY